VTVAALLALAAVGGVLLWRLAQEDGWPGRIGTPAVFGLLAAGLWEVACRGFGVPRVLLPPPSGISAAALSHGAVLGADLVQTVLRSVLPGYASGCAAGFLGALALDRSPFLRRGVLPLGSLAGAMPIVGIAPIMVMWFGFDWPSKAAVVVVMTVFPMLVNTTAGLQQADAMGRDLMRSYAAGYWQTLVKLRLPAAMPFVFAALKLNASLALIGAIIAEFFGTPIVGIGFRISTEVARMNLDLVWAEIGMAALVGSSAFVLLSLAERAVTFWHPSQHR